MDTQKTALPAQDAEKNRSDKVLHSRDLFYKRNSVVIMHDQEIYHLRLTRQNRLLLTK